MDLQTLKIQLGPELAPSWQEFQTLTQSEAVTAEAYLAWLFEAKKIDFTQLEQILTASPIEIGSMPASSQAGLAPQILRQLGQGAMGVVHLAKDPALLRKVAYKQLLGQASSPVIRRFLNEVRITAQLQHPAIVPVYQLSLEPGTQDLPQISYSMKLVRGLTLKEKLQEVRQHLDAGHKPDERLNLRALLEVFLQVCDAMDYSHTRQVIHRDLKPANLMIGPYGDVYVMDWGIARRFQDADQAQDPVPDAEPGSAERDLDQTQLDQTQAGQILGTPRYMSPQQAAGKNAELDGRSDLFALGLILFEILTLKQAFTAANQIQLLKRVLKAELEPFEPYSPHWRIPPELQAVVVKATQRKPDDRYQRVAQMSSDIRRFLRGETVSVYSEPLHLHLLRVLRKHARATVMTVMALVLGCLSVIAGSLVWQMWTSAGNLKREAAQSRFLSAVAARAQLLDQRFLLYQGRLEGLAATARQSLLQGKQPTGTFYTLSDFRTPGRAPADLAPSGVYAQPISLRFASIKEPEGSKQQIEQSHLQSLQPLQARMQALMPGRPADIRDKGLELISAAVRHVNGSEMHYPGRAEVPELNQAYWRQAAQQTQPFWGTPAADATGRLSVPLIAPLTDRSADGQNQPLLGVAELNLDLEKLAGMLRLPLPEATRAELIDPQGQVLIRMHLPSGQIERFSTPTRHEQSEQIANLQQATGVATFGQTQLAWFRLSAPGWIFVVSATP